MYSIHRRTGWFTRNNMSAWLWLSERAWAERTTSSRQRLLYATHECLTNWIGTYTGYERVDFNDLQKQRANLLIMRNALMLVLGSTPYKAYQAFIAKEVISDGDRKPERGGGRSGQLFLPRRRSDQRGAAQLTLDPSRRDVVVGSPSDPRGSHGELSAPADGDEGLVGVASTRGERGIVIPPLPVASKHIEVYGSALSYEPLFACWLDYNAPPEIIKIAGERALGGGRAYAHVQRQRTSGINPSEASWI